MAKKKRVDLSKSSEGGFESPFAALVGLKADLPASAPASSRGPKATAKAAGHLTGKKIVVRREKSGRSGKTVTVLEGTGLGEEERSAFAKKLKQKLGCGATIEGENIVLLGDVERRVSDLLQEEGANEVVFGSRAK